MKTCYKLTPLQAIRDEFVSFIGIDLEKLCITFSWKQQFEVRNALMLDLFLIKQPFIAGQELCGFLVDYCDVFISCLDSHSDGTHSLQRFCCWLRDVMLHFSKSVQMKNKLIYILDGLRASPFSAHFILCENYSFNGLFISWRICWHSQRAGLSIRPAEGASGNWCDAPPTQRNHAPGGRWWHRAIVLIHTWYLP